MAAAIANLILHPPDNSFTLFPIILSSNPTSLKHVSEDDNADDAFLPSPLSSSFSLANSATVAFDKLKISCLTNVTLTSSGNPKISFAAIRFISVVFPAPFCPTIPYLLFFSRRNAVGFNKIFAPKPSMMFCKSIKNFPEDDVVPAASLSFLAPSLPPLSDAISTTRAHTSATSFSVRNASTIGPIFSVIVSTSRASSSSSSNARSKRTSRT